MGGMGHTLRACDIHAIALQGLREVAAKFVE
jgi:hypothetical protein